MRPGTFALPILLILIAVACGRSDERVELPETTPPVTSVEAEPEATASADHESTETEAPRSRETVSVGTSASDGAYPPAGQPSASPTSTPEPRARPEPTPAPQPARTHSTPSPESASTELPRSRPEPEIVPSPPRPGVSPASPSPGTVVEPAPPPPAPVYALIPEGTVLQVRLSRRLSSEHNSTGDRFEVLLDESLVSGGETVAPVGTVLTGRLPEVEGSGRVRGRARLALELVELNLGGETYPISTNRVTVEADGTEGRDAKVIGGGAGLGALIGAIAGGRRGAAIGAAIGGGAGTSTVLVTKGKEVEFEPEQKFSFRLQSDVEIRLR